jgi:hypothetical protein
MAARLFIIETTVMHAHVIMGNLILSLKHPGNRGPSSHIAKKIASDLLSTLVAMGFYEDQEIEEIERGFAEAGININSN